MGKIVSATHWRSDDGHVLPYVPDGVTSKPRVLGVLRPRPSFGALPRYADTQPMVSRDRWSDVDFSQFRAPILDQGQHGSCVGHGSVSAFQRAWAMAGHPFKQFSSCYIYGKINGGRDRGAVVSDAQDLLLNGGVCLETTVPEGMIFERQFPPNADQEAKNYRAFACMHCGTFDELGSALMCGWVVSFGILVGSRFGNLDAEGVAPVGGNGGHCLHGYGLVRLKSGAWGIRTQNSWSDQWGRAGCCVLVERHFTAGQNWAGGLDAFAIKSVLDSLVDPNNPPPVPR